MKSLQFKITLQDIEPPIWRRILVPENYSFWDLHVAIQDAMGWTDSHLHGFETKRYSRTRIGIPSSDEFNVKTRAGWNIKVKDNFDKVNKKMLYTYDFGDSWEHEIVFEKIVEKEIKKPECLDGARACPPEDCGGTGGYENFCKIMKSKKGKEYQEMKKWYEGDYDPEAFDPLKVKFNDPRKRLDVGKRSAKAWYIIKNPGYIISSIPNPEEQWKPRHANNIFKPSKAAAKQ